MIPLEELEAALRSYEDSDSERARLSLLIARLPESTQSTPEGIRAQAQALGVEAFYYLGLLEKARDWADPPLTAVAARWRGYALFDLGEYRAAKPELQRALREESLLAWVKCKLEELIICCDLYESPTSDLSALVHRLGTLLEHRNDLRGEAPLPIELYRVAQYRRDLWPGDTAADVIFERFDGEFAEISGSTSELSDRGLPPVGPNDPRC